MAKFLHRIILFSFVIGNLSFVILAAGGCGDNSVVMSLSISPTSATVGINQYYSFYAIAKNSGGIIVSSSPTWSVEGGIGSITSTGLFKAVGAAGTGNIIAAVDSISAKAAVTITEKAWLAGNVSCPVTGRVPGIKVYLEGHESALNAFSDSKGVYSISNIPAGTYEARTLATNYYQAASYEVTISSGETKTWDITLDTQPGTPVIPTTTISL